MLSANRDVIRLASSEHNPSFWRPDNQIARPPSEGLSQKGQAVAEKRILVRLICIGSSNAISRGERKA
jgi:hypothetical protein